jgi:orotidine-5'-phosphate decarboxylase
MAEHAADHDDPAAAAVRGRLALAVDVDGRDAAVAWMERMASSFGVAKLGYQALYSGGLDLVEAAAGLGLDVFADVKLHDIPNTVFHGARALARRGATYLTVHATGGADMLRAAVEGAVEGSGEGGGGAAVVLAVTVLTSEPDAPASVLAERVETAAAAGCGGVVCAVADLAVVRDRVPGLLAVTPGIRLPDDDPGDQGRIATPGAAVRAGAGLLVLGRSVTAAPDPEAAVRRVAADVEAALGGR